MHVGFEVETDCRVGADRVVYDVPRGYRVRGLYVHPRTGLLRWQEWRASRPKPPQFRKMT